MPQIAPKRKFDGESGNCFAALADDRERQTNVLYRPVSRLSIGTWLLPSSVGNPCPRSALSMGERSCSRLRCTPYRLRRVHRQQPAFTGHWNQPSEFPPLADCSQNSGLRNRAFAVSRPNFVKVCCAASADNRISSLLCPKRKLNFPCKLYDTYRKIKG